MAKKLVFSFLKGILAGLAIGLGGFLYILMTFLFKDNAIVGKVVGALLFPVGLSLVCSFNLHLYTGKIGGVYFKKQSLDYYLSLPIMLVGNALGAIGLGFALHFAFKDLELVTVFAEAAAQSRVTLNNVNDYLSLCIGSFLCGTCVYLSVKLFSLYRLRPLGFLFLVFFVFVFVYSGFQHCIANMFYFAFANKFEANTFINLVLCILFNSLGPVVGALIPFKDPKTNE